MKMIYNGTPVKSLNVHHFEQDTNSATVQPSDLQAGVTCFARGEKVTGTGKCFEFAEYGTMMVNFPLKVPMEINIIEIASTQYPLKTSISLRDMKNKSVDFSVTQELATIIVGGIEYPITIDIQDNIVTLGCNEDLDLEVFYGKDKYL